MKYRLEGGDSYPVLEVDLDPGDEIVAESGAMAWMDPHVKTETSTKGGAFAGLKRKLLTGESFFQNTYRAEGGAGRVALAPGIAGDVTTIELNDQELEEPKIEMTVRNARGNVIRRKKLAVHQGINRIVWGMERDGVRPMPGPSSPEKILAALSKSPTEASASALW